MYMFVYRFMFHLSSHLIDECTIHSSQYLTIGVRYVKDLVVREEWISFVELKSATAEAIFDAITQELSKANIPMKTCIGAGLDGCATMTGHISGVAARYLSLFDGFIITDKCITYLKICINLLKT